MVYQQAKSRPPLHRRYTICQPQSCITPSSLLTLTGTMVQLMIKGFLKAFLFWENAVVPIVFKPSPPPPKNPSTSRAAQGRAVTNQETPTRSGYPLQNLQSMTPGRSFRSGFHSPLTPRSQHRRLPSSPIPYANHPQPPRPAEKFLKMYATIFPFALTLVVFILTLLTVLAGSSPTFMPGYSILSINTTGLQQAYEKTKGGGLPIHDVYSAFLTTSCEGYWGGKVGDNYTPLVDAQCSKSSGYSSFLLATLIQTDLITYSSSQNLSTLNFPSAIEDLFNESVNLQLHVAFIFFVISLILLGFVIIWSIVAFWQGVLGAGAVVGTSAVSVTLLIGAILLNITQTQTVARTNDLGQTIGISAFNNNKLITLSWMAFGLNCFSILIWALSGCISTGWRGVKKDRITERLKMSGKGTGIAKERDRMARDREMGGGRMWV